MSFYDWYSEHVIQPLRPGPGYSVVKYPNYLRKRPSLIRHSLSGQEAVASFASDEAARRFVEEMCIGPIVEAKK